VVLYMRRRPNQPMDIELVLYALLAAVDVFSTALAAVLALVSLYWLALAKLQARGAGSRSAAAHAAPRHLSTCDSLPRPLLTCRCSPSLPSPPTLPHQEEVHLLVPPDAEMYNFWVTMVLAVVGQAVGLLWVVYGQVK
jgi:hypothetical protein